jgi:hypothetical protein
MDVMSGGMMGGMGLVGVIFLIIIMGILLIAALIKYLFFR